jgi:hypothetical protein
MIKTGTFFTGVRLIFVTYIIYAIIEYILLLQKLTILLVVGKRGGLFVLYLHLKYERITVVGGLPRFFC